MQVNHDSSALVSWDGLNKWPQTGWFKTEIDSLSVPETRSLQSTCRQRPAASEGSWEESCLVSASFWELLKILGLP